MCLAPYRGGCCASCGGNCEVRREPAVLDGMVHRGPGLLAAQIRMHGVVPASLAWPTGHAVIGLEVMLGGLLLFSSSRAVGIAAVGLLTLFSTYLALAYLRQRGVNCGCFGRVSGGSVIFGMVRNTAMILALFGAMIRSGSRRRSLAAVADCAALMSRRDRR